jgi:hypothetical protein
LALQDFNIETDHWLQGVYVQEIKILCEQVEIAVEGLNKYIRLSPKDSRVDHAFFFLRSIVSTTAMISQFFWSQDNADTRTKRRAQTLRGLFDIQDSSVLRSRSFRHHLIHLDERIDRWAVESPRRNMARRVFGPRGAVGGLELGEIIEHYVPDEHTFIFRGDEFRVQRIVTEVVDLKIRAIELDRRQRNAA